MAEVGANFEKKWGTNKIKSVSIYLRKTHELEFQIFYFVPPVESPNRVENGEARRLKNWSQSDELPER